MSGAAAQREAMGTPEHAQQSMRVGRAARAEARGVGQYVRPEANMTSVICKHGKTQPGTTRIAIERGSTVLVVRGVPAQVCDTCGEAYLSADAVDRLQEMLAIAAQGGVQVEVRERALLRTSL